MKTLNIGILAHVDAGKTSLTERLLFSAGVIKTLGSVDKGNTQTDTMALERRRGITIKAAVTSFNIGDLKINLIDTPGHPDFISEVERSLRVLDAVILVISAVEGIQPQTQILARTLKKLKIPTIIFINKIDRMGARNTDLVEDITTRLFSDVIVMSKVTDIGSRQAKVLPLQSSEKRVSQTSITQPCPIFFGSAITGVGVPELTSALEAHPVPDSTARNLFSAVVFKLERGKHDERVAYIRMYGGELHTRSHVEFHRNNPNDGATLFASKITAMRLFQDGQTIEAEVARTGDIVQVWGLSDVQIGDYIGQPPAKNTAYFARPSLEVAVQPQESSDRPRLYSALQRLREQDPLIHVHQTQEGALSVRLYGEVQREIIKALLQDDYGLNVVFEKTQIIYVEKVRATGTSYAEKFAPDNIFIATLGFRIISDRSGSGIVFKPGAGIGRIPGSYLKVVEEMVYKTLQQGVYGWEVTDCIVELSHAGYESAMSKGTDFRRLTPLLVAEALQKAGTEVYEPINRFELDAPDVVLPQVLQSLANSGARVDATLAKQGFSHIEGILPVRRMFDFERAIPDLTGGEGIFVAEFDGYQKTQGKTPVRDRTDNNPFNKEEYLRRTLSRGWD